ncbi:hypothetical protein KC207_11125 [Phycicoccus sp. BSK3Z-2]|uniref:MFS transporter n=1 Tax=Phycicoccus avicenniae TaxID=2828860 RepID=A0A941I095_9MICO|nr:hypothetical protein [Phycicoccus avicenniae]MBR7743842.1 hypothetical protein [Phycicoccus avicenniae]
MASRLATPGAEAAVMTVQGLSWGVATVVAPVVGAALLGVGPAVLWLTGAGIALLLAVGHAAVPLRLVLAVAGTSAREERVAAGVAAG